MSAVDDHYENLEKLCGIGSKDLSEEASKLWSDMEKLHCPFTWIHSVITSPEVNVDHITQKCDEIAEDEESIFLWRTFILNLVLCYEYSYKDSVDISYVCRNLKKLEEILGKAKGLAEDVNNSRNIAIGGLEHVIFSCKCFVFFKSKQYEDVNEVFSKIKPFSDLSENEQASVWGIQAAVFMEYGYEGTKKSLEYIECAIKLDPNQGEWYYLRGKAMGRQRRIDRYNDRPSKLEVESLERASELSENISYMIFLAQVYREDASRLYSSHKDDYTKIKNQCDTMNDNAFRYYKEAMERGNHHTNVFIRCAIGFLKLPPPYRDLKRARKCVKRALELSPDNPMGNHYAGQYYERTKKMDKALEHYEKAGKRGAYGAYMDLIRLSWKMYSDYDPVNWNVPEYDVMHLFNELLHLDVRAYHQHETYCQIGSYWYFIHNNFKEAFKWWKKVLVEDPTSYKLKTHRCCLIHMTAPVDINFIIFDEAQFMLKDESISLEARAEMNDLVENYSKSLGQREPISWREKILTKIRDNLKNFLKGGAQAGGGVKCAENSHSLGKENLQNCFQRKDMLEYDAQGHERNNRGGRRRTGPKGCERGYTRGEGGYGTEYPQVGDDTSNGDRLDRGGFSRRYVGRFRQGFVSGHSTIDSGRSAEEGAGRLYLNNRGGFSRGCVGRFQQGFVSGHSRIDSGISDEEISGRLYLNNRGGGFHQERLRTGSSKNRGDRVDQDGLPMGNLRNERGRANQKRNRRGNSRIRNGN